MAFSIAEALADRKRLDWLHEESMNEGVTIDADDSEVWIRFEGHDGEVSAHRVGIRDAIDAAMELSRLEAAKDGIS